MNIYQGEPLGARINVKNDEGTYVTDLTGYVLEAMLVSGCDNVASWSTQNGTISIGQETVTIEGVSVTRGYAAFSAAGSVTAGWQPDTYCLEVAKVLSDGRAIGVARHLLEVLPARIRRGI